jgi:hypothetical protein
MMDWVMHRKSKASSAIRQKFDDAFQVTGGVMSKIGSNPTLLMMGQNFSGFYSAPPHAQVYTQQVRRFKIKDNRKSLKYELLSSKPTGQDPNLRRRDLNIVPTIKKKHGKLKKRMTALSGVFTLTDGIWTVPVEIKSDGSYSMANSAASSTFKQSMNNYACATCGLYSEKKEEMYLLLLGGITFGYFSDGEFVTDSEIPFTNQVTALKVDKSGHYKQYFMTEYPTIASTGSNPGNTLLFGAGAYFIPKSSVDLYSNKVMKFDRLKKSQTVGYIVGGIASTLPNTNTRADSTASSYIFEVRLERQ